MIQKYYTVIGTEKKDNNKHTFYKGSLTEKEARKLAKEKQELFNNVVLWEVCAPRAHKVLKIN